jgi:hypothetical protein
MEEVKQNGEESQKGILTLDQLAEYLGIDVETLADMTLEEIEKTSLDIANTRTHDINAILDKRDFAVEKVQQAFTQAGLSNKDMNSFLFPGIKID